MLAVTLVRELSVLPSLGVVLIAGVTAIAFLSSLFLLGAKR